MCCEDARRSALPSHPLIDQQAWYWLYTDLYWMRLVLNARPVNSTPVYHDSRSLTYKSWTTAETDSSMNNTSWTAHFPCIRDFTQVWSSYNIYRYTLFIENFSNTMCAIRGMRYCMKFLFISITKLHVIPICSCPQCLFVCLFT